MTTRFVAYMRGSAATPAEAEALAAAVVGDLDALRVRTYAGEALEVGSVIEPVENDTEPLILDETGAPTNEAELDAMAAAAQVSEPSNPAAEIAAAGGTGDGFDALRPVGEQGPEVVTPTETVVVEPQPAPPTPGEVPVELHAVDPALEADPRIVQRDEAGNGFDVEGNLIDPVAAPALPLYTLDGENPAPELYPLADVHTEDGRALYTYTGDTPGGPATADGADGIWHVYEGPTVQNSPTVESAAPTTTEAPAPSA